MSGVDAFVLGVTVGEVCYECAPVVAYRAKREAEALYAQELAYDKAYEAYLETANASE